MFVLGEADSRTPPECGGEELFRALKFLKRPTAMVMLPRETHELSRSGEPWHPGLSGCSTSSAGLVAGC